MYIVSNFHDYYDTAMIHGIDKECVYNRDSKEIDIDEFKINLPYSKEVTFSNGIRMSADPAIIGFCGKIYPIVIVTFSNSNSPIRPEFFYSAQDYIDFMDFRTGGLETSKRWYGWMNRGDLRNEKGARDFFETKFIELEKLFLEHKCPIFSITPRGYKSILTLNPRLESLRFMKVVDPTTAFQEIYLYKAGVLGNNEKETVEISDKVKLQQHGFDKYSFKTMKGDKKPRAKNRGKIE